MTPDRTPIDDAVLELLRTRTGRPVGDAELPRTDDDEVEAEPYAILYPLDAGLSGGALVEMHTDGEWSYQVTMVGLTRQQVSMLAARVAGAFLDEAANGAFLNALLVPGQRVIGRDFISSSGIAIDGETFQVSDRYRIWTTPA